MQLAREVLDLEAYQHHVGIGAGQLSTEPSGDGSRDVGCNVGSSLPEGAL